MRSTISRPRRLLLLNLVLVFLLGLFVAKLPSTFAQISGQADDWKLLSDARELITANYVDKPDQKKLAKGAIQGMLEALDDPYAEYISAEDAADFDKAMTGSFSGVGCQIEMKDGWLYVASPMEDSPAFNAGILAGDRVSKVDGVSTHGLTDQKCIKMITGPEGTPVKLDVLRGGQEMAFTLTRAKIVSKSVRGYRRLPDATGHWDHMIDPANKIAYVRLSQFTPTAPDEFVAALDQATAAAGGTLNGLVLDLRYNPGGIMDTAIDIVNMFVDEGATIMSTSGRAMPQVVYRARKSEHKLRYPVAILVNGSSASASEIVAGSLSESLGSTGRVVVIGTRTFGKGLVQSVANLPSDRNAILKLTTQHYYLPSGKMIQRTDEAKEWGVDPTPGYYLPISDSEALASALKRREWDILRKPGTEPLPGSEPIPSVADQRWTDPAWIEEAAKDRQLAGAMKTIQAKIATGQWTKLSDADSQAAAIATGELKVLEKMHVRLEKELVLNEKRAALLESGVGVEHAKLKPEDLWPDTDLTGGAVEVRDKDGKVVAELAITGRDLEQWLQAADVKKQKKDEPSASTTTPPPAAPKQ